MPAEIDAGAEIAGGDRAGGGAMTASGSVRRRASTYETEAATTSASTAPMRKKPRARVTAAVSIFSVRTSTGTCCAPARTRTGSATKARPFTVPVCRSPANSDAASKASTGSPAGGACGLGTSVVPPAAGLVDVAPSPRRAGLRRAPAAARRLATGRSVRTG